LHKQGLRDIHLGALVEGREMVSGVDPVAPCEHEVEWHPRKDNPQKQVAANL
jgi:hypothetical protein